MPSHDVTMVAQWAALHSVIYNWTGLPTTQLYDENGEEVAIPVLPTDENVYAAGDTYTVDDTYVANTVHTPVTLPYSSVVLTGTNSGATT